LLSVTHIKLRLSSLKYCAVPLSKPRFAHTFATKGHHIKYPPDIPVHRGMNVNENKVDRFDLLDGLRGIAAIGVMIYHYTLHNGLHWLGGAWVAVDLFFILSGFVIAHSYGNKILNGMGIQQFLRNGPVCTV
jgi:hypothetical protein